MFVSLACCWACQQGRFHSALSSSLILKKRFKYNDSLLLNLHAEFLIYPRNPDGESAETLSLKNDSDHGGVKSFVLG